MSDQLPAPGGRFRRPDRSVLTFFACTIALVALASLATTVLVQYGSKGTVTTPKQAVSPVAAAPAARPASVVPVPVDRVVGSYQSPGVTQSTSGRQSLSLGELLTPPLPHLPTPTASPTEPSLPVTFPTGFPTIFPSAPPPSPVTVPVPEQVPVPGTIVIPLPGPLPDIVLFPGGLVNPSPSSYPIV